MIDSRKITEDYRIAVDKLFLLTQNPENRDTNKEKVKIISYIN